MGVHKQMCLYGLPEVEALSVGKNRKGSTQRPLSTDEHDSETQTNTHQWLSCYDICPAELLFSI